MPPAETPYRPPDAMLPLIIQISNYKCQKDLKLIKHIVISFTYKKHVIKFGLQQFV